MSAPPTHPPPRCPRAARWLVLALCCAGSAVSGSSHPSGEAPAPPGLARVISITPGADGPRIWDFTGWYPSLGAWMRQNPDGSIAYEICGFPSNCVTRPGQVTASGASVGVDVPLIWEYTDPTGSGYWYTSGLSLSVAQDRRSLVGFRRTTVFIPEALYPALRERWRPHIVTPGINYLSDLVTVPLPSGVDGSWRLDLEEAPDGGRFGAAASLVLSSGNPIAFHVQATQPTVTKSVLQLQGATGGNSLQLVLLGPERTLHSLQGTVARQPVLLNAPAATNALTVEVRGQGAVGRLTNGAPLVIGRDYALTAIPRPGHLFSNWVVAGLEVTTPVLRFTMTSNLVITANIVPNPFPALQGAYTGLFADPQAPAHENAGWLSFTLAGSGTFSGRLRQGAASLPFSGRFGLDLSASCSVRRPGTNHLLLHLRLTEGSDRWTGTVGSADATSDLAGFRAGFSGRFPATHYQGTWTLLLPGARESGDGPMGHGVARVRVSRTGLVTFQGTLGDGTPALQVVPLAAGGQWPCYLGLQAGRGSLFGWLTFLDTPTNDLAGSLQWTRPAGLPGRVHPGGFTNRLEALGSRYVPPAPGTRALDLADGRFVLEGGHLDDPLAVEVTLSEANRVTVTSTNAPGVTLTLRPATGGFRGSFHHPATGRVLPVHGVLLQKQKLAGGHFLDTDLSGSATLLPRPQQP